MDKWKERKRKRRSTEQKIVQKHVRMERRKQRANLKEGR